MPFNGKKAQCTIPWYEGMYYMFLCKPNWLRILLLHVFLVLIKIHNFIGLKQYYIFKHVKIKEYWHTCAMIIIWNETCKSKMLNVKLFALTLNKKFVQPNPEFKELDIVFKTTSRLFEKFFKIMSSFWIF